MRAMEYKELATLYHMDPSSARESNAAASLKVRLEAPSTFRLGVSVRGEELFIAVPRELSVLTERVLRRERKVSKLMQAIPGIAGDEVLRGLVFDEVVNSNYIENIHSTRRQIEDALETRSEKDLNAKRFREFARLYLDLVYGNYFLPETPEDIRRIYDLVMDAEESENPLDGRLFRKDRVSVSDGLQEVHAGLDSEERIIGAMEDMLRIVSSPDIPALYGALASHFLFEYAHPFYDGNGRTGRYLLSLFLEEALSKPTALSLSRAMASDKSLYYRAFQVAENPLNHAELTFFVMTMLELILKAQDDLIERLEENGRSYRALCESCDRLDTSGEYAEKEVTLLFGLAQQAAFGMTDAISLGRLADLIFLKEQQTRKYLSAFEERGIARKVRGRNPVTFALTDEFKAAAFPAVFR